MQHATALKWLNLWLADHSTELLLFITLYLMEYEGKYLEKYLNTLEKYLNTVIKYKLKNVFKYSV